MPELAKGHTLGTHRLVPPQVTLARLTPLLPSFGITRCADITGLDCIGIPVHCAIRPLNRSIQVSNGKGLDHVAAKVSACMEAAELYHAEHPPIPLHRGSLASLRRDGFRVVRPAMLQGYRRQVFFSRQRLIDWVRGDDLLGGREVWLPASAAYLCAPSLYDWTSNGLASGNHQIEATLHALFEVIERDALARLERGSHVTFSPDRCKIIDVRTIREPTVQALHERIAAAGLKLVLIWMRSCVPVHTLMAVLLDRNPVSYASAVNTGSGTHLSPAVAAVRAISEAAQSRATFIHGSREDLTAAAYQRDHRAAFAFFDGLPETADWRALRQRASDDLLADYRYTLRALARARYRHVFRVDMTRPPFDLPVVKVWVPGLRKSAF